MDSRASPDIRDPLEAIRHRKLLWTQLSLPPSELEELRMCVGSSNVEQNEDVAREIAALAEILADIEGASAGDGDGFNQAVDNVARRMLCQEIMLFRNKIEAQAAILGVEIDSVYPAEKARIDAVVAYASTVCAKTSEIDFKDVTLPEKPQDGTASSAFAVALKDALQQEHRLLLSHVKLLEEAIEAQMNAADINCAGKRPLREELSVRKLREGCSNLQKIWMTTEKSISTRSAEAQRPSTSCSKRTSAAPADSTSPHCMPPRPPARRPATAQSPRVTLTLGDGPSSPRVRRQFTPAASSGLCAPKIDAERFAPLDIAASTECGSSTRPSSPSSFSMHSSCGVDSSHSDLRVPSRAFTVRSPSSRTVRSGVSHSLNSSDSENALASETSCPPSPSGRASRSAVVNRLRCHRMVAGIYSEPSSDGSV